MNQQIKNKYLEIYKEAHNNAVDLLKEAELLFNHKHFARAYALAFTALEEISKSQFAADVFTGLSSDEEFKKFYKNHRQKIDRVAWAHLDANEYPHNLKWVGPDRDDVERINPQAPLFQKRQGSLYVEVGDKDRLLKPSKQISAKDAEEIMQIVEVALQRIWEVTEYHGHQIGTKGFMK